MFTEMTEATMLGELVKITIDELKVGNEPWQQMPEEMQADVLERVTLQCQNILKDTITLLSAGEFPYTVAQVEQVVFKDGVKAVIKLPKTERAHEIADAEGSSVIVVVADHESYLEAGHDIRPEPDQPDMLDSEAEADPLYTEAVQHVINEQKASVSNLQRNLRIGYNRAHRIMNQMEAAGIVSGIDPNGGGRTVLEQQAA